jgi:cephalosporin-C deacetylase-like acetyl esterase
MTASMIRERMVYRTERLSERIRAARPVVLVQQVERTQVVVCCGVQGGGMRATKFSIRAGRRNGRF